jgi:hypothetical protein
MSSLGDRIKTEIEAKLEGIVAEEELRGMIDAALPKARERVMEEVVGQLKDSFKEKLVGSWGDWKRSDEAKELADDIRKKIVEWFYKHWLQQAEKAAAGDPEALSSEPVTAVREYMRNTLVEKVQGKLHSWREDPDTDKKADEILEKIIPRSAAMFMEHAALGALNSLSMMSRKNLSLDLHQGLNGSCPNCCTYLTTCGKCGSLRKSGDQCCGQYI